MTNWNDFKNGLFSRISKYIVFWEEKLEDLIDVWYTRLLWEIEEDVVSYINSPTFAFTATLFMLIPVSELYYTGSVYYFYIAIMALIFDIIIYYIIVILIDFSSIPGLEALAVRMFSISFYIFSIFNPEVFDFVVMLFFHGSGDFVLSEELFSGALDPECGLMDDKKEILFRVFWGLSHMVIIGIFIRGFKLRWDGLVNFEKTSVSEKTELDYDERYCVTSSEYIRLSNWYLSWSLDGKRISFYSYIFKRSLTFGFVNVFNSIERYPVFWALPTFIFFSIADFSSFASTPFLIYNSLAFFDTVRFLSYDFLFFEIAAWWWLFCGLIVYFGDFGSFSDFKISIRLWLRFPFADWNIVKLLFISFFLIVCPIFWIVTDNESLNSFLSIAALENSWVLTGSGKFLVANFLPLAFMYFLSKDSEHKFVFSVFASVCSISIFFLGLCLNHHNNVLEGINHDIFTYFDLLDYIGLGHHELFIFGYDYISLVLCLMTSVVFSFVMYFSLFAEVRYKIYYFSLLLYLYVFIIMSFLSLNLFTFYIAFEATMIPIALLITQWGSSDKRYFAARQYLFYSIISGLPLLAGLGHLYNTFGTLDYVFILNNLFMLSYDEQLYLWFAFLFVFAVKVPLFPLHSWLLNAHVEASTGVSIILAAVLLKIGSFGMIRYLLGMFHVISTEFAQHIIFFALFGVVYASWCAITEIDLKRLVAFTSVAHMNLVVIGLFMFDESAFYGSVITMLAHSVISAALFFIIGVLYSRIHAREIIIYGGMAQLMPILSSFLFFFAIANAGFPCSFSFIGELFLFMAIFKKFGLSFVILIGFSSLLLLYANLRLFIYIAFGTINDNYMSPALSDFGHIEICVCSLLFLNAFLLFVKFDHYFFPLFFDYLARYFVA